MLIDRSISDNGLQLRNYHHMSLYSFHITSPTRSVNKGQFARLAMSHHHRMYKCVWINLNSLFNWEGVYWNISLLRTRSTILSWFVQSQEIKNRKAVFQKSIHLARYSKQTLRAEVVHPWASLPNHDYNTASLQGLPDRIHIQKESM